MTIDAILDELAKRGLIDGNIVARISAAHKREVETLRNALREVSEFAAAMDYAEPNVAAIIDICADALKGEACS